MTQRFYTTRDNILPLIEERRRDDVLQDRIREFYFDEVGSEIPFFDFGVGILARHLPVSRNETLFAKALSDEIGLGFGLPSFIQDRYVNCSAEKRSFLTFNEAFDGKVEIVNGTRRQFYDQGKANLASIVCQETGEPILDYHLQRTQNTIDNFRYFDFSPNGLRAPQYYAAYLAMFGGLNCLLEDFHGGESGPALVKFTKGVFEPAFDRVQSELGINPIITPIPFESDFGEYVFCPVEAQSRIIRYKERIRNNEL